MKRRSFLFRAVRAVIVLGLVLGALGVVAHLAVDRIATVSPPKLAPLQLTRREEGPAIRAGRGWTIHRGVQIVSLAGSPEEIGTEHSTLLQEGMQENERVLWDGFRAILPFPPARVLLFDVGRVRYRDVARSFPEARLREVAAEARAFQPDPFADELPTFTRMVMLHALYDIALGFESSPLLGCTSFGLGPEITADGHVLFARAFDFEAHDVFDKNKAVFVVRESGRIPFASVAWPGFVGVVTGMNAEGVAVAAHGGRAREPASEGVPVAFSLREALATARTADQAADVLAKQPVMVSHIVFVGDRSGRFLVVERAPGVPAHVRPGTVAPGRAAVTNHFEGPLAHDPRDERVRKTTTTLARRARIDEMLRELPMRGSSVTDRPGVTVPDAVAMLRDRTCAGGEACPLGDRRAIDAFIATHGVVFDLTSRAMWVSEGPRLSGRFVKIDLPSLVSRGDVPPDLTDELEVVPADPALWDGRYDEGRARAGAPLLGGSEWKPRKEARL